MLLTSAEHVRLVRRQQRSRRATEKAPLVPLPVIEVPFERVAIDMVGPLPRTKRGNRYVLVLCDFATRYPEAIPVRSMESTVIAEELMTIFSQVGMPRELLSDQGTNFTSELMADLYRLLGIRKLRSSPYHPEGNGLVERFNGTLKSMLQKFAADEPESWDKYIPYLLFAYQEVPQASTGFSPFELLYGHAVRGPLQILRESWTGDMSQENSVVQHVVEMREQLQTMTELAQESMAETQQQQQKWYDQGARSRVFSVGDKVLVLLPTAACKLQAQWKGPYTITRKVSLVNYEVELPGYRKRLTIFHVNLLRKWEQRTCTRCPCGTSC